MKHFRFPLQQSGRFFSSRAGAQRGLTLIESLIALLVLVLGILGLVALQARTIVESRVTNNRATAIRLIADLNERMALNPAKANTYITATAAGDSPSACATATGCSPDDRAKYDMLQWKAATEAALPGPFWDASLQGTQLRVVIGWNLNEKSANVADSAEAAASAAASATTPEAFKITTATGGTAIIPAECSTTKICHIQYLELPYNTPVPL